MKSFLAEEADRLHTTMHRVEHRIERFKHDRKAHSAELDLDAKACAYQVEHPQATYSEAFDAVMHAYPALAAEYAGSFGHSEKVSPRQAREFIFEDDSDDSTTAGNEIDRLAQKIQSEHPSLSYESCLGRVRESHPELWKKYAGR